MRLNWKVLSGCSCLWLVILTSGCGGINTTQSVSPATFLLPGVKNIEPRPAHQMDVAPEKESPVLELARY